MTERSLAPGPLADLLVVEVGESVSAPHAARLLAGFGATVVKVEQPAGDPLRQRGPFPDGRPGEPGGLFEYFNAGKQSVTWDLSDAGQRAHFDRLLDQTDVLLTNLPIPALTRLELQPAALRARFPRLIITTVTPFSLTGPYAGYRGDELITYAMSGLAHVTPGMPDTADDPEIEAPLHPTSAVAETTTGVFAAIGTMFAVLQRDRTGEGCYLDLSQQAATTLVEARGIPAFNYGGLLPGRVPPIGKMPNFYLPCQDGYAVIATFLDHQWARFVQVMGDPDWAEMFPDSASRTANWEPLKVLIGEWLAEQTCDGILQLGLEHHLPIFPVFTVRRLAHSDHARERGSLSRVERDGYDFQMPGPPVQPHQTPWETRGPAPRLGEHTATIEAGDR